MGELWSGAPGVWVHRGVCGWCVIVVKTELHHSRRWPQ
jgi:hypothetical protein